MADYDLAIIGSGGAAFGAAIEARRSDARVVMHDRRGHGGWDVREHRVRPLQDAARRRQGLPHGGIALAKVYDFEIIQGVAAFQNPTTLTVDGHQLAANAYLIATGAEPTIPPLPGLAAAGYLTSTTAMEQATVPSGWSPSAAASSGWS
jgi:mercuric reductase